MTFILTYLRATTLRAIDLVARFEMVSAEMGEVLKARPKTGIKDLTGVNESIKSALLASKSAPRRFLALGSFRLLRL